MRRTNGVSKTWRLLHVDLFGKYAIKEGIMYIELMNHQTTRNCNGEKQLDGHLLNDGDMLFVSSSSNHPTYSCILDSACSYHTTLDKDLLDNYMFVNSDSFMIGNDDPCCYPFFGFPQNKIRK